MKRSMMAMTAIAALVLPAGVPRQAEADNLLYTNGPVDGNDAGWNISSGYAVTDSFTLSSSATLGYATVGLLVLQQLAGDAPTTLDWLIGTSPFGSDVSSGTSVSLTNQDLGVGGLGAEVFQSTFALSGTLSAGTYYLTLQNGQTLGGSDLYWDQSGPSGGPSTAYQSLGGPSSGVLSESFSIYSTPEPSSLVLLTLGALGLIGHGRCRKKAKAA